MAALDVALAMTDVVRDGDRPPSPADADSLGDGASRADPPWAALRRHPLHAAPWLDLVRDYRQNDLPWQAGYAARQALRCDPALRPELDALQRGPWVEPEAGDGQLGRPMLAGVAELIERFSARTRDRPDDWLTWLYLARLYDLASGEPTVLARARDGALAAARNHEILPGESLHWLGVWRLNAGDAEGAVGALSALIDLRPLRHGSLMYLGEALLRSGRIAAAEKAFSRASLSANPDFLLSLAQRVYTHNYWQEAIEVLRKALALRPDHVPTWLALARIQYEVYALADCRAALARLQALSPGHPEVRLIEIGLHGRIGDAHAYLAALEEAYASGDPLSRVASSVAMTALYDDRLSAAEVAALHRRVCAPIEASVRETRDFANPRSTGRRLRIGYVTGDLHRQHPVNLFLLPVLLRHDRERFAIAMYHTGSMYDGYTRLAHDAAEIWLEASRLDDRSLQQAIVADQIDLLIDLGGHTASHRLGLFALRAAPVQATFLGYPHSTGLSRIDWLIGDATVSPAGHAGLFSEGIAQLPGSVFCWAPVDDYPLPLPRPADAPIVFASFNNAIKLSPRTIAVWAAVLRAVPGARLLLKAPSLHDASVQARFVERFAAHGIPADRLDLRGPSGLAEMMQQYGEVDVALDPTPYNGGTTTFQALWMGVPVITLQGGNFVGRMGASFLRTLGQPGWVADDEAGYVAIAQRLASHGRIWRAQRSALRSRMAASPLCDIERYVRDLEALYGRMWTTYARGERPRLLPAERPPAPTDHRDSSAEDGR